jgi:hypothetical protein
VCPRALWGGCVHKSTLASYPWASCERVRPLVLTFTALALTFFVPASRNSVQRRVSVFVPASRNSVQRAYQVFFVPASRNSVHRVLAVLRPTNVAIVNVARAARRIVGAQNRAMVIAERDCILERDILVINVFIHTVLRRREERKLHDGLACGVLRIVLRDDAILPTHRVAPRWAPWSDCGVAACVHSPAVSALGHRHAEPPPSGGRRALCPSRARRLQRRLRAHLLRCALLRRRCQRRRLCSPLQQRSPPHLLAHSLRDLVRVTAPRMAPAHEPPPPPALRVVHELLERVASCRRPAVRARPLTHARRERERAPHPEAYTPRSGESYGRPDERVL